MASTYLELGGGGIGTANSVPAGGYIEFLASPATAGLIRVPGSTSGGIITAINSVSANAKLLDFTSSNELLIGESGDVYYIYQYALADIRAIVGGNPILSCAASSVTAFVSVDFQGDTNTHTPSAKRRRTSYNKGATVTGTTASDLVTHAIEDGCAVRVTAEFETLQTGGSSGSAGDYHYKTIRAIYTRTAGGAPTLVVGSDDTLDEEFRTLAMTYALVISSNNIIARSTNPANTNVETKVTMTVSKIGSA